MRLNLILFELIWCSDARQSLLTSFIADHLSIRNTYTSSSHHTTSRDSKQRTRVAYPLRSTSIRNHLTRTRISQSADPLQLSTREPNSNGKGNENDALPIRGPRSRDPGERTTNQYGFIETNDKPLPEKKRIKRQREISIHRDENKRQEAQVANNLTTNQYSENNYLDPTHMSSLQDVEQMARGKRSRSDRNISQNILLNFQSATSKKTLDSLASELIEMKTVNTKGTEIALSELMLPRDQTSLIRLLGAKGCYKAMMNLLRNLAKIMDVSAQQYAYTAAITSLAQASNPRIKVQAIKLLDEMDVNAIPPNTYTFTAAFLAVDGGKAAIELLKRAKEHTDSIEIDVHLYNSCIHACSRNGDDGKNGWQNALSLFRQQMPRDGIQPNEQTYASLLHACAKAGQLRVALSIFDEMKRNSKVPLKLNKVWGAALRACATAGNSKKAMEVIGEMIQSGVRPNTLHLNSVLAALSKEDNDVGALELVENMQAGTLENLFQTDSTGDSEIDKEDNTGESTMPDLVSVNTVLTSFAHANNYVGAKAFFERLIAGEFTSRKGDTRYTIFPDIISYNTLLSACDNPREAISILEEVSSRRKVCFYIFMNTANNSRWNFIHRYACR
jgi:pentatricopeptide repeat protein